MRPLWTEDEKQAFAAVIRNRAGWLRGKTLENLLAKAEGDFREFMGCGFAGAPHFLQWLQEVVFMLTGGVLQVALPEHSGVPIPGDTLQDDYWYVSWADFKARFEKTLEEEWEPDTVDSYGPEIDAVRRFLDGTPFLLWRIYQATEDAALDSARVHLLGMACGNDQQEVFRETYHVFEKECTRLYKALGEAN